MLPSHHPNSRQGFCRSLRLRKSIPDTGFTISMKIKSVQCKTVWPPLIATRDTTKMCAHIDCQNIPRVMKMKASAEISKQIHYKKTE